jgi:hypothetical protein
VGKGCLIRHWSYGGFIICDYVRAPARTGSPPSTSSPEDPDRCNRELAALTRRVSS